MMPDRDVGAGGKLFYVIFATKMHKTHKNSGGTSSTWATTMHKTQRNSGTIRSTGATKMHKGHKNSGALAAPGHENAQNAQGFRGR